MIPDAAAAAIATDWRQADPEVTRRIAASSVDAIVQPHLLFHGTLEHLHGKLAPSCDGCVWFADAPVIAQTYIPATGGWMAISPREYLNRSPDETWEPRTEFDEMAIRQAGFRLDIRRNERWIGSLEYGARDGRFPRLRDFRRFMIEECGYPASAEGFWRVRTRFVDGQQRIMPHAYRQPGTLVIAPRPGDLRLKDLSDLGTDLCNSYRYAHLFATIAGQGYDGVITSDLCQTEAYGNVGHTGIGLFARAADRLPELRIPAVHAAWSPRAGGDTPEFAALRQQIYAASPSTRGFP